MIELEKVKKDREVAMKQKDALVKTLSEAASALESSLKVTKMVPRNLNHAIHSSKR